MGTIELFLLLTGALGSSLTPIPNEQRFIDMHEQQLAARAAEGQAPASGQGEGAPAAESGGEAAPAAKPEAAAGSQFGGGAELGYGKIGEDTFVSVVPKFDVAIDQLRLALQVPLRLRVQDKSPKSSGDYFGYLRKEDWDSVSEFLAVIDRVGYGTKGGPVRARVGKLSADVGHGTIVRGYSNNLDVNAARVGMQLQLHTGYGGIDGMVGDIGTVFDGGAVASRVLGARGYVKPLSFVLEDSPLNVFQIGATVVSDLNAPRRIATDAQGQLVIEDGEYVVEKSRAATVYGFDLGVELLRNDTIELTPYSDLNFIADAWGWHLGLKMEATLGSLMVPLRVEYRRFEPGYYPAYFSTFYELERFTYPVGNAGAAPKRYVANRASGDGINGVFGDLALSLTKFQVGALYEDFTGAGADFALYMAVPGESFQMKIYYARTGIDGFVDAFGFDKRSMFISQLRWALIPYTAFWAQWTRRWRLETDVNDEEYGRYVADSSLVAGVELDL